MIELLFNNLVRHSILPLSINFELLTHTVYCYEINLARNT